METRIFYVVVVTCVAVIICAASIPREGFTDTRATTKILIVSVSARPKLSQLTWPHMRAYCNTHMYDFETIDTPLDTSRHLAWSKITLLLRKLMDYNYIVVVEDDVFITNKQIPITAFINQSEFDKNIS